MPSPHRLFSLAFVLLCAAAFPLRAQGYTHFEARQTHSIALTPDGNRLLALNSPDARLAVFDVSNPNAAPVLVAEILVGLAPVAVRARTDDEVWVVNEVGDSISIVSLGRKAVVATLRAPDEPADVVFAQGKAFVTCGRNNLVRVFDTATRLEVASIPLGGLDPRALATDAAGTTVYAAFLLSGNATTVLVKEAAPAQPPPTNTALPAAPQTALIVPANDSRIHYTVLDRDVAQIDAATGTVTRYLGGAGTNLFDLAVHPVSGDLWVANTEARNLVRFEPALRGHIADHRLTRLAAGDGAATVFDLNPAPQAGALAQPTALVFSADGSEAWVAAFGSDRVAKIDTATGTVLDRIDVRTGGGGSDVMRGPRALALHPAQPRLFVLNKLSDTVTLIATDTGAVVAEVPLASHDTMPATIREGRGFLFDARLSGNGTASCATCHLDADRDGIAWDLGDPGGDMVTVIGANLVAHDTRPRARTMHPMKGPMVTQTLRGMQDGAPFHWRGDRATLADFNPTFDRLMAGSEIAADDMSALAAYLLALRHHPNPNREKDGALPLTFDGANPLRGQTLFTSHVNHCAVCHELPRGTNNNIDLHQEVGASQPIKTPPLATTYQRIFFNPRTGQQSLSGFGMNHDGTGFALPTAHPYVLDTLSTPADFADVTAFVMCFDSGTAPAVGDSVTVDATSAPLDEIARMETANQAGAADLVVEGTIGGERRHFVFSRALQQYVPGVFGEAPLSRGALLAALSGDDTLTFLGVQPFEGARFGSDVNRNAVLADDSFFTRSKTAPLVVAAERGVLANDTRVAAPGDLAELSFSAGRGDAVLASDGALTYTPGPDFGTAEIDIFAYRVLIAGDAGNATSAANATVSTMASAAARYTGHLKADGSQAVAGFVNVIVTRTGAWSGSARLGATKQALKGRVEVNGELRPSRAPALDVALRLSARPNGHRSVGAFVRSGSDLFTGTMERSPFTRLAPAPGAGRHVLNLTVASSTGTAPADAGRATLKVSKLGVATIAGRLGDRTKFSCGAVVAPRTGGGWRLPVYSVVYKFPPGTVSGSLEFDPALTTGVAGTLHVVKPPQTRTGPFQDGFTVDYAVSNALTP
ncbi:MAG: hypothetical protein ABMA13_15905 [Chthoniobacteraceae bacterium]